MKTNKEKSEDIRQGKSIAEIQTYELLICRSESGVWSFNDESLDIVNEPFVCGINEIIDQILRDAGFDPKSGTKVLVEFADINAYALEEEGVYNLFLEPKNYNKYPRDYTPVVYISEKTDQKLYGAFCPVFLRYFPLKVKGIKVKIKKVIQ